MKQSLSADTESEGAVELNNDKSTEQIEGKLLPFRIAYGMDYDLGDIVTAKKIGNVLVVQNKRIVEIVIVHEPLNSYVKPNHGGGCLMGYKFSFFRQQRIGADDKYHNEDWLRSGVAR